MYVFILLGLLFWKYIFFRFFEERFCLRIVVEFFGYVKGICRVDGVVCLFRNFLILDVVLLYFDEEGLEGEFVFGNLFSKFLLEVKMLRLIFWFWIKCCLIRL